MIEVEDFSSSPPPQGSLEQMKNEINEISHQDEYKFEGEFDSEDEEFLSDSDVDLNEGRKA